jgi:hypothetical protein
MTHSENIVNLPLISALIVVCLFTGGFKTVMDLLVDIVILNLTTLTNANNKKQRIEVLRYEVAQQQKL